MSTPAVILSADDYAALLKRIEGVERLVADRAPAATREFQTPREVAKRFGLGIDKVYAALESGRLPAEQVPGKGKAGRWFRIRHEDARVWFETFQAKPGQRAVDA